MPELDGAAWTRACRASSHCSTADFKGPTWLSNDSWHIAERFVSAPNVLYPQTATSSGKHVSCFLFRSLRWPVAYRANGLAEQFLAFHSPSSGLDHRWARDWAASGPRASLWQLHKSAA